jgi:hypothetical protein
MSAAIGMEKIEAVSVEWLKILLKNPLFLKIQAIKND